MPTDYVEDYEEVTGKKREDASSSTAETKVVTAPAKAEPKNATVAQTKAPKAK